MPSKSFSFYGRERVSQPVLDYCSLSPRTNRKQFSRGVCDFTNIECTYIQHVQLVKKCLKQCTLHLVADVHDDIPFPMITSGRLALFSNATADEMALLSATITGGSGHLGG